MIRVGIDEVGRGCWAGPLVVGAVILTEPIAGLKDSKLLTKARRLSLSKEISKDALAIGLGWVEASEIDKFGLTRATTLAITRALEQIKIAYDEIIIDGSINYLKSDPRAKAVIKADNIFPEVSAASIIAKVARDDYMAQQALLFPQYGFSDHVGYGTQKHLNSLKQFGIINLHRKSFKPIRLIMEGT
jgi:ribonuclease HII